MPTKATSRALTGVKRKKAVPSSQARAKTPSKQRKSAATKSTPKASPKKRLTASKKKRRIKKIKHVDQGIQQENDIEKRRRQKKGDTPKAA